MENTLPMCMNDQDENRRFSMFSNNTNRTMINMYRTPRVRLDTARFHTDRIALKKGRISPNILRKNTCRTSISCATQSGRDIS